MLLQGIKVIEVSLYITFQCLAKWAAQDSPCKISGSCQGKYEYELQKLQRYPQCHQQLMVAVLGTRQVFNLKCVKYFFQLT